MTSLNGTFSALLAFCAGNSPVTDEFPAQRPVTRGFDVFFYLCLNERLSKQSRSWWFETPSRPLWRHSIGPVVSDESWLCRIVIYVFNIVAALPWLSYQEPILLTSINLFPVWIGDYIHYKMWDNITNPYPNFNGATAQLLCQGPRFLTLISLLPAQHVITSIMKYGMKLLQRYNLWSLGMDRFSQPTLCWAFVSMREFKLIYFDNSGPRSNISEGLRWLWTPVSTPQPTQNAVPQLWKKNRQWY